MTVTATQLAELAETVDKVNARNLRFCAEHPDQAPVRTALLRAEKDVHAGGWDAEPILFYLTRHTRTGRMTFEPLEFFKRTLAVMDERPPQVLDRVALAVEDIRANARTPEPRPPFLPSLSHLVRAVRMAPDGDMLPGRGPQWAFHGVGFMSEAWTVVDTDNPADNKAAEALIFENRLYTHEDRIEMRGIHYVGRDGHLWEVTRYRRTTDITIPRCAGILTGASGTVPNALSRLCNAFASNAVPIAPDGEYRAEDWTRTN